MGVLSVATYRALPGKESEFSALLADHIPALKRLGFATDRPAIMARASDGTIVEIFEWKNEAAKKAAHKSPDVDALWRQFEGLCEIRALKDLPEAQYPFAGFEVLS